MSDNKSFKVQNGLDVTGDANVSGSVTATSFIGDGSQLTGISGGSGGLDSAAVTALVDSDYVGGRVPPVSSYRLSSYFSIPAVYAEVNDLALGNGAQVVDPSGGAGTMNSIAIGQSAETRGAQSISIGQNAITNANFCTVVGANAGTNASSEMVCVGNNTNADTQSTSVGYDAGVGDGFSARNVALGYTAGKAGSTVNSVAIGNGAGSVGSGRNSSIAIGFLAGQSNQAANNIIVNATGSALNRTDQFGIDIRTSTAGSLTYDTTNDWVFGSSVTLPGATISGHIIPDTNAAYDLGSAEKKFRHLYLSNNSLYAESGRLSFEGGQLTFRDDPVLMLSEVQAIAAASDTFEDFKAALASL